MTKEQEYIAIIIYFVIVIIGFVAYHFGKYLFQNKLDLICDWSNYILNHDKTIIVRYINKLDKLEILMLLRRINRKKMSNREIWILQNIYNRPYAYQDCFRLKYLQAHIVQFQIKESLDKL